MIMSNEKLYANGNLCSVVLFAIIIRWSVSLHSYSGQNKPPLFGDYEAQRHWMEITVNLPVQQWYFNTSDNDLMYWGLDYPPLTAYHSYVNGKLAQHIDPSFVKLFASRGYESYSHKLFMRSTVLVTDVLIYFSSILMFFNGLYKKRAKPPEHGEMTETKHKTNCNIIQPRVSYLTQIAIALLYPGLIMIDHGHFQYNSISLGFTVAAISALIYNKLLVSSFFFCLALNYKQMSLYHSLPFFVYMLSHCFQIKKISDISFSLFKLFLISGTVLLTFGVIWYPFLNYESSLQVIKRLFPLSRGVFEDKVSNVWCAVNVLYKINKYLTQGQITKLCIVCVLTASLPSLIHLYKKPNLLRFLLSLINVSLSFFLFSYQVHEKSILLVALPILLFFPFDPFPCFWFLFISNFSMLPLYLKDGLIIPFLALSALFSLFVFANVNFQENKNLNKSTKNYFEIKPIIKLLFLLSMVGCLIIFLCLIFVKPPVRYPDIWPLLTSVYCCFHFYLFLLYFNHVQLFRGNYEV